MIDDKELESALELEKYKPFQRLDFVYNTIDNLLLVRAQLFVLLHEEESINPPSIVTASGFAHSETLFVQGKASGKLKLSRLEYLIDFSMLPSEDMLIPKVDVDYLPVITEIIAEQLNTSNSRVFVVNTKITKNPTEEVTNTISQDGDIEIKE